MRTLAIVLILAASASADWLDSKPAAKPVVGRLLLREVYDLDGKRVGIDESTDKPVEEKGLTAPGRLSPAARKAQNERPKMLQDSQGYWYKEWADGTVQWCVECNVADAKAKAKSASCPVCGSKCDCGPGCQCDETGSVPSCGAVTMADVKAFYAKRTALTLPQRSRGDGPAPDGFGYGKVFELDGLAPGQFPPTPVPITVYDERDGSSFVVPATPGYQAARPQASYSRPGFSAGFGFTGSAGRSVSFGASAGGG